MAHDAHSSRCPPNCGRGCETRKVCHRPFLVLELVTVPLPGSATARVAAQDVPARAASHRVCGESGRDAAWRRQCHQTFSKNCKSRWFGNVAKLPWKSFQDFSQRSLENTKMPLTRETCTYYQGSCNNGVKPKHRTRT